MAVKAIPEGYYSLTPYLVVKGAAEAIEFYTKAFGATEMMRMPGPGGKIMHAELKIVLGRSDGQSHRSVRPQLGHRHAPGRRVAAGDGEANGGDALNQRSRALTAAMSSVSTSARFARQPAGDGELASRLYLSAVSKHRATPVMMITCGADRGAALLK